MTKDRLKQLESLLNEALECDEVVIYDLNAQEPINIKEVEYVDDNKESPFVVVTI